MNFKRQIGIISRPKHHLQLINWWALIWNHRRKKNKPNPLTEWSSNVKGVTQSCHLMQRNSISRLEHTFNTLEIQVNTGERKFQQIHSTEWSNKDFWNGKNHIYCNDNEYLKSSDISEELHKAKFSQFKKFL